MLRQDSREALGRIVGCPTDHMHRLLGRPTRSRSESLLLPIVMGSALIRRHELRVPSILLMSPIVVFPLVIVLNAFTTFGHPGYLETVVNFGLALLCLDASSLPAPTDEAGSTMKNRIARTATSA